MIYIQLADHLEVEDVLSEESEFIQAGIIEEATKETLKQTEASTKSDLTIVITDDKQIQELNRQYLGIDAPTDVLSFPSGELDLDSNNVYLGDIVISYERAQDQAQAAGHTTEDEMRLLVVHGVLHLLGYDHAEQEEKQEMWEKQAEILKRLGSSITAPP